MKKFFIFFTCAVLIFSCASKPAERFDIDSLNKDHGSTVSYAKAYPLTVKKLKGAFEDVIKIDKDISACKNLIALDLYQSRIPLDEFPRRLTDISSIRSLTIGFYDQKKMPRGLKRFAGLQHLAIRGLQLTELPDEIGSLENLRELNINCGSIASFPESMKKLMRLEKLTINSEYYGKLKKLPDWIGSLKNLKTVVIKVDAVSELPASLSSLPQLESLTLSMKNNDTVPESIGGLASLKTLVITESKFKSLPASLAKLTSLENLEISYLSSLTGLPDELGDLPRLKKITISSSGITELPQGMSKLKELTELKLVGDLALKTLPANFHELSALKILTIDNCGFTAVPEQIGKLPALEELTIKAKDGKLPDSLASSPSIKKVKMLQSYSKRSYKVTARTLTAYQGPGEKTEEFAVKNNGDIMFFIAKNPKVAGYKGKIGIWLLMGTTKDYYNAQDTTYTVFYVFSTEVAPF